MVTVFLTEEILFLTEKLQSTLLSKDLTPKGVSLLCEKIGWRLAYQIGS